MMMARAIRLRRQAIQACGLALVWLACGFLVHPAAAQQAPTIAAPQAILVDFDSGTVLFERAADTPNFPASVAKMMTMAVVFREIAEGRLTPDSEFKVSEYAWRRGGAPSGGATMFASLNSTIKVSDLLRGAIIPSGNDATIVLAEGIAGNELAFTVKMNEEAKRLGLTDSHFTNSNGLSDPDQKTTARDLSRLAAHIIRSYPDLYKIYSEPDFLWNKIRQNNRNPLLGMSLGADGFMTGYLKESGFNLVGSAVQNDQRLIVVILGAKSEKERAEDARKLLEWGFRSFESRLLFDAGQTVGEAVLYGGEQGNVPLTAAGPIRLLEPRNGTERVAARIRYEGPVHAPVEKGAKLARLEITRGEQLVLEIPLIAAQSVPEGPLWRRAVDGAYELVVGLLREGYAKLAAKLPVKLG
ncbi:D-alanyl-D-alanine carboxypeptidase (penicillin-binding protein 5/6) [Angulomicrobium amanitiforme]|uniref:serine-type D-Ala-D-Ala carboxypeptidase n=2 Tax=Ancylobacter amanitiformis TaxID=217069 RepID=A0ABU0LKG4_9HYPH|nr:D-alanyl-D-alanine carboxypeptidase family protein [Ancylobacter amanitiformis]MDQ0509183.1 D-alanyl-D-alanine carboxypeptidase (penicillin-binding protein 5/6) [Ancylobacter amanitiformis]